MSRKTIVIFLVIIIALIVLCVTAFLVDFNLVVRNNEPKLCINVNTYDNGVTKEYMGLGYKIIRYNIASNEEIAKFGFLDLSYDSSLNSKIEDIVSKHYMIGFITEFDKSNMQFMIKSNSDMSSYDEALVKISSSTLVTKDSKQYMKNDLKVGNEVKIEFSGIATRSIPPQITASRIEVIN